MRVVLDTNVLISAEIRAGLCREVRSRVLRNHDPIASSYILDELEEKLIVKFKIDPNRAREARDSYGNAAILVDSEEMPADACRDPDDVVILGTAVASQAKCIVTGDKDLLVLKRFRGIDIIRPTDFFSYEQVDPTQPG